MKILLIEDEPKVAAFIKKGLEEDQHQVEVAYDGEIGHKAIMQHDYDVIIMDVMLPYMNGLQLSKSIREQGIRTPVLMLTALNTTPDIVDGLNAGADDYLAKPFHFSELLARTNALHRRTADFKAATSRLTFMDLTLDLDTKTATRENKEIILTAKEYALLELFMNNCNKVLSRAYIAQTVWGLDFDSGTNTIDVYINYLRNKIEKGFSGDRLIHTVVGMGYVMKMK
ncbi:MAG: response regulator transcription factor [Bacteroidetes bacterium]|uniref:response regulator transcription factor n=1 Tax=unclassified Chitinophaga TaxID=2619133 RepID=UPI0009D095F1|nr:MULTISPECIES: response regulator transcription factor [unclassified Chitinophaga]MBP1653048.1 response regulator transcription factor [Bacteroidota bacterium]OMP80522.1 DNA-binding response regulator [[Flexibacter] sp. ATCC 35208]WPV69575.1 response regulator transcription factor [Chitinophaga sp. LS1]